MKRLSVETPSGSLIASAALHVLSCAAIVVIMNVVPKAPIAPDAITDLEYEVFNEPPKVVNEVKRVAKAPEPEMAKPVEKAPPIQAQELQDQKSDVIGTQAAAIAPPSSATGEGSATAVPYYKIKPKYPKAALVAGEEGWILLKIDVNETGDVENVRIVDGTKRNLFGEEARRAVEKWKYRPFVNTAGAPVRKADHQVRVDFKLDDA